MASLTLPESSYPNFAFGWTGQSNAQGQNPLSPSPQQLGGVREHHVGWMMDLSGMWSVANDPNSSGPSRHADLVNPWAGASMVPGLVRRLLPLLGNLAVIPAGKGGSVIGSWLYRPPGGLSYLDMVVDQFHYAGLPLNLICWLQGESDAKITTTEVQYQDYLAQVAARFFAEFACPLMVAVIPQIDPVVYPNQGVIQQAQRNSWGIVPHVIQGPDLSDIPTAPENAVHLAHPAKIDLGASRYVDPIVAYWQSQQ